METLSNIQDKLVHLLKEEFAIRSLKKPGYSLRRFSIKLGLDAPVVSEIMNGKRRVSIKTAQLILKGLAIDPDQANKYLFEIQNEKTQNKKNKTHSLIQFTSNKPFEMLSSQEFDIFSNWWYFGILSLAETKACPNDVEVIAERLGLTKTQVQSALNIFLEKKLIEVRGGYLKATGLQLTTTTEISDTAIRKNHHQGLELAQEALDTVPLELREFGAMTMAIDPKKIPEAKKMIINFRKQMAQLLEVDQQTEVYRLQMQFFPLTQKIKSKNKKLIEGVSL